MIQHHEEQKNNTSNRGQTLDDQEATERRLAHEDAHSKKQNTVAENASYKEKEGEKKSNRSVGRGKEHTHRQTEKKSKRMRGYDGL
ncbi:MAG: hypothetical protein ICV84_18850 [Flavisolibacter sp.]|nr:hypothetical protein [Flavisolibacter sp.]